MGAEAMTYAEKKAMGYGTVQERLGKDAQGNFDDCNLTYAPAVQPMCTPGGFLYSKEAIFENLLAQKKEKKRQLKLWEDQERERAQTQAEDEIVREEAKKEAFYSQNYEGVAREGEAGTSGDAQKKKKKNAGLNWDSEQKGADGKLRAYWLPSKTPEMKANVDKPSLTCRCPASGKKLKLKDLFPVSLMRDPENARKYIDPLTKDELTNRDSLVAIRTSGVVMKKKTYENLVKPDGELNGKAVSPKDVVEIQTGGTGFSAHDKNSQSKKKYLVGMGSGMADLRGQNSSAVSRFGLKFSN
jgi:nitric oxide synthase-interacting protein